MILNYPRPKTASAFTVRPCVPRSIAGETWMMHRVPGMRLRLLATTLVGVVLTLPVPGAAQVTWHVDDDCLVPGSGTSQDPFCTIQSGVNAATDGDTVLVGAGTYSGVGNRDISLFGKAITQPSRTDDTSTPCHSMSKSCGQSWGNWRRAVLPFLFAVMST